MQIVVITGSPHKNGSSSLLADRFIQGSIEAGHSVERFDAAFMNIHPCLAVIVVAWTVPVCKRMMYPKFVTLCWKQMW